MAVRDANTVLSLSEVLFAYEQEELEALLNDVTDLRVDNTGNDVLWNVFYALGIEVEKQIAYNDRHNRRH